MFMRDLIKKIIREEVDYDFTLDDNHPVVRAVRQSINDFVSYEDWFTTPYSDNERTDYYIAFNLGKVNIWKERNEYVGTLNFVVNDILIGDSENDEWERMYWRDDLPEICWDRLEELIIDKVETWIPNLTVDVNFKFKGPKN